MAGGRYSGSEATANIGDVNVLNASNTRINPATEDTLAKYAAVTGGDVQTGGGSSLQIATESWTADDYRGKYVWIYQGTGAGQVRSITTNTNDTLQVVPAWTTAPDNTSKFLVLNKPPMFSDVPSTFVGDEKVVTQAATAEALVASSTPCKGVWIGAPADADGVTSNTKIAFIGDSAGQNIPLELDNILGFTIAIDDAAKIFVKVGVDGEKVQYRVLA
jgi:hypothetical protein